ncbi:MAG: type II secretion system F family protein [Bacteroidota bacterium]
MPIKIEQYQQERQAPSSTPSKQRSLDWEALLNREIELGAGATGLPFREALYAELSILLSAGLDIQKSLELIESGQKKKNAKTLVAQIRAQVLNGDALSAAMQKSDAFSDYEVYSIQIGEESGHLIRVLDELSVFFGRSIKYRQQLMGALAYPSFVIGFAFLVLFFLLNYLVPMFSEVYARFDGDLPAITQGIIDFSDWVGKYLSTSLLLLLGLGLVLYFQRKKDWFRRLTARLLLGMPIFGGIFRRIYLARFCQSMYFLLGSNVPLLKTIGLVKRMVGFYPIEQSLEQAEKDIFSGQTLHESLQRSNFYPSRLLALLRVGEEASNLDQMFEKMAQQYNNEVEQKTNTIGHLIEPVLIVGLGLLVGFILVAMYLPLFQLSVGLGT